MSLFKKSNEENVMQFFEIIGRHHKVGRNIKSCIEEYDKTYENPDMHGVCQTLIQSLSEGNDFAPSLARCPDVFEPFIVELVRVGENTNQLDEFFDRIVTRLRQDMSIRKKINSAILMPKISLLLIFGGFIFAIYYLVPKISEAFKQINIEIPLITRIVMAGAEIMVDFWFVFPIIFAGGLYFFRKYKMEHPVEYSLLPLRIPFYKDLVYSKIQYDLCDIFSLCLSSNVRTLDALRFSSMAMERLYMRKVLEKTADYMEQGLNLVEAVRRADSENIVSREVISMMQTGIETSRLEDVMRTEANSYLDALNYITETIGDKISASVLVPTYAIMIVFFLIIEWPLQSIMSNVSSISQGLGK